MSLMAIVVAKASRAAASAGGGDGGGAWRLGSEEPLTAAIFAPASGPQLVVI